MNMPITFFALVSNLLLFSALADDAPFAPDPALFTALTTTATSQRRGGQEARQLVSTLAGLKDSHLAARPMEFQKTSPDGGVTVEFSARQPGSFFDPMPMCQHYLLELDGEIQDANSPQPTYLIKNIKVSYTSRLQCV